MKSGDPVHDRLLDAARELFSRRGYDATSVREITSRAKANLGAITYHFGSKKALYHAVIDQLASGFAEVLGRAAASPGTGLERIEALVRGALAHVAHRPHAPVILLRELANDTALPPPIVRMFQRNVATVAGLVADGQKDGSVRAGDPLLLALSVISQPFYFNIAGRGLEQALDIERRNAATWSRIVDHVATSVRQTVARNPQQESQ